MLLTCPNCETVFRIDSERIGDGSQAVRCSVCAHVWQAEPPMLVPEAVTHADVLAVVKKTKPLNLVSTELFDVFRGENVPQGQKSIAYSFTYRNAEKTLKDKEVNAAHDQLVAALAEKLTATIRDT